MRDSRRVTRLAVRLLPIPLALIALAGCGGNTPSQPAASPPASAQPVAAPPIPASGPVGTAYHDGPLTVTVDSVKVAPRLTAPGGIPDPERSTNGQWAQIHVTEQNGGQVPVQPGQVYVKTADGTTWDSLVEGDSYGQELPSGTVAAGDRSAGLVLVDMPVGRGTVVYEDGAGQIVYRWPFNG